MGNLYGTPLAQVPEGKDIVLEIDLQGVEQITTRFPDALAVLLLPPSAEVQAERLRARGDDEQEVARRIAKGVEEQRIGRALTTHVVVNDDLDKAVSEVAGILEGQRKLADARPPD